MNYIKYLIQFILIILIFLFFKVFGLRISSFLGGKLLELIGPMFRSKKIIISNIKKAYPIINSNQINKIISTMWNNYGRIFAEYVFIKKFRNEYFSSHITVNGNEILKEIKNTKKPVIFVSGHFSNFELMAMTLEKLGIKLAAIYRPLNNKFLNILMENIRKKHICKFQIKKGIGGLRKIIKLSQAGYSTALMIDQRVTEGIKLNFFGHKAFTTTIPAQLVKKYGYSIVPIFIERSKNVKFKITIKKPIKFSNDISQEQITLKLNNILEKMILSNPGQWIWSHNRWK